MHRHGRISLSLPQPLWWQRLILSCPVGATAVRNCSDRTSYPTEFFATPECLWLGVMCSCPIPTVKANPSCGRLPAEGLCPKTKAHRNVLRLRNSLLLTVPCSQAVSLHPQRVCLKALLKVLVAFTPRDCEEQQGVLGYTVPS